MVLRTFDREEPADLWDPEVQDRLRNLLQTEQQRRALLANRQALINNGDLSPPPNEMLRRLLDVVYNRHLPAAADEVGSARTGERFSIRRPLRRISSLSSSSFHRGIRAEFWLGSGV